MTGSSSASGRFSAHWLAAGIAAALLLIWAAVMAVAIRDAALPPDATGRIFVVFPPGLASEDAVRKIAAAGGRPVSQTWFSSVWVVASDRTNFVGELERQGAVGAYGELPVGIQLAGCFALMDARIGQLAAIMP